MNKNIFILSFCLLIISGCHKNEDEIADLFSFESLTAEKVTLFRGQSTIITANAIGDNISFLWSASVGPVLANGNKAIYVASPCCFGEVVITCVAKAGKQSESKSLVITVLE
jgi:hypothetical protein